MYHLALIGSKRLRFRYTETSQKPVCKKAVFGTGEMWGRSAGSWRLGRSPPFPNLVCHLSPSKVIPLETEIGGFITISNVEDKKSGDNLYVVILNIFSHKIPVTVRKVP